MARGYPQFGGYSNYLSLAQSVDEDAMSISDYAKLSMDMDRNRRQEENQEFNQDAKTIQMMLKNYHDTKSLTLKQHISDAMRAYWPKVDPKFHSVLAPILAGSPLDEEVEKEEYWDRNAKPRPRKPIKQSDQEPEVYNQELAEFHFADYLYGRLRDTYFGIPIGPLKESLVLGEDIEGNMRYVVKFEDTPARMVTSKGLNFAKIEKDKGLLPGSIDQNDPVLWGMPTTISHGQDKHTSISRTDLLTGRTTLEVEKTPSFTGAIPAERLTPEPEELTAVINAMNNNFDVGTIKAKDGNMGMLAYKSIYEEIVEEIEKTEIGFFKVVGFGKQTGVDEKRLRHLIYDSFEGRWPGRQFNIKWGRSGKTEEKPEGVENPHTKKYPFGKGTRIYSAPGQLYGVARYSTDIYGQRGKYEGIAQFVYDNVGQIIYRQHDGRPLMSVNAFEGMLARKNYGPLTEWSELQEWAETNYGTK